MNVPLITGLIVIAGLCFSLSCFRALCLIRRRYVNLDNEEIESSVSTRASQGLDISPNMLYHPEDNYDAVSVSSLVSYDGTDLESPSVAELPLWLFNNSVVYDSMSEELPDSDSNMPTAILNSTLESQNKEYDEAKASAPSLITRA